jgi:hypothetical protein
VHRNLHTNVFVPGPLRLGSAYVSGVMQPSGIPAPAV